MCIFLVYENLVVVFNFRGPKSNKSFDFVDETMDIEGFSKLMVLFNNVKLKIIMMKSCYKYVGIEKDYISFFRDFDLETK